MNKVKVDVLKKPKIPFKKPIKKPNLLDLNNNCAYPINSISNEKQFTRKNSVSTNNSDEDLNNMYIENEEIENNYISIVDILQNLSKMK